ncbi:hypothetical protein ONZ51_g5025 [Trametes cubensis]|uniref:Uncharacterized protein n=1 Tax=Trametes cubensis TaxID=1111947 RepID=A0AAD7TVU3_9APHY|nr:hypothetical protein ONZ51_g5025 [Trametes cubensis]
MLRSKIMRDGGDLLPFASFLTRTQLFVSSPAEGATSTPTAVSTSTPRPSIPPASTTQAPFFNFISTPDVPKCSLSTVGWSYGGGDTTIALRLVSSGNGLEFPLVSNLDVTAQSFNWYTNYTSGTYAMTATGPDINVKSLPFQIGEPGSDPTCMLPGSASVSPRIASTSRPIDTSSPPSSSEQGSTITFHATESSSTSQASAPPDIPSSAQTRPREPSEPVTTTTAYTSTNAQSTQNTQGTQSGQSSAGASGVSSTAGAEQGHTSPIASIVVGSVAAVIVIVLTCICLSTALRRRARNASFSRPSTRRRSANWIGLSFDDDDGSPDTSGSSPVDEKSLEGSIRKPPVALARLEPNRRKPSTLSFTPIPVTTPTSPLAVQLDPVTPTKTVMDGRTADSPTDRRNSYRTRKPVPRLLPTEDEADELSARELESSKEDRHSPTSAVPSSATSRMYRGRDSGYSVRSRSPIDKENARASSIIDPQLFGVYTKPMQEVVPEVPPLPSFGSL